MKKLFAWYNAKPRDGLSAAILAGAIVAALVVMGA